MKQQLLFTPGPLLTSKTVKEALQIDMGSRDPNFINVIQDIRKQLVKLALADDSYTAVLLQGSGSYGVEAVLQTTVNKQNHKVLVVANGSYGERMTKILDVTGRQYSKLAYNDDEVVNADDVVNRINEDISITHLAIVHSVIQIISSLQVDILSNLDLMLWIQHERYKAQNIMIIVIFIYYNSNISLIKQTNFFDAETKKPLPDTVLDLTIYYVYKDKESSFKFIGRSDNTGQLNFHLFIPNVPAAIAVYTASHLAYWSTQQLDKSNKDYMLFPHNAFSINMNPQLSTSTIQYTLSGLLFDAKANKALQNAQISLTGIEEDSKSKLPTGIATSESDGKYSVTITISPYSKYLFTLSIEVPKYLSYEKQFEQELDLTKPVATLSKNYEKVQLEQVPGKLILSGTITDLTNIIQFIKDAQISIKYDTTQPAILAISDAVGKYTTTINVPVDEKLSIIETISALNFITKVQDQKIITVKQGVAYELIIDTQLDRVKQNIIIKDTLIDQLSKPIISASIQLTKSIPNVIGFDYTKTVMDDADGSFSFPFQCYQGVPFKADFTVVAPTYLPNHFETQTSECADLTIKSTLLILSKTKVVLILKANVIDATQQPFKGLVINYTVNPPIDGLIIGPLTSDANGIIQFPNLQVLPRSKYSFQIIYKNAIGESIKQDLNYLITDEKSQEHQFIIQYQSIVHASIGGTLTTSTGKATSPVQLQCTCDSKGKDGKPLDITTTSKADGTYQFDFETLAESDQKINCKVITKGVIVQPSTTPVQLLSPKFAAVQSIVIFYNTVEITVKGIIQDIITNQPIEGADVTLLISPEYMAKKSHKLKHLATSTIVIKTVKDGSYQTIFKVLSGQQTEIDITVKKATFEEGIKKITVTGAKSEVVDGSLSLKRIPIITKIHSTVIGALDKKPIPNAMVQIVSSTPETAHSKYYNVQVQDDAKGQFYLDFQCYSDLEYSLTMSVEVPSFVTQTIQSSKFLCSKPATEIQPLAITLEKIVISSTIIGKVIDPHGKPKSGLTLQFNTDPATMPLSATTAADGTWSVTDTKIIPNTPYIAILTFQDGIKEPIKLTQAMNIATANQKVQFADVHYADLVDATVTGNIVLEKGSIKQPVTLTVSCPQNKDAKGIPFIKDFQTTATGTYNIQFQILAQSDQILKCNIVSKNIIQPVNLPFQLQSPDFTTKVVINSKLPSSVITISGLLSDQIKAISQLPNVEVTLTLKPADPLNDAVIKTKTDANNKYLFKFEVVKGQKYEGTITVNYAPEFQQQNIVIQIDGTNDQTLIKDIILSRIIVQCKIQSELDDMNKKPIPNASLLILTSKPQMDDKNLYNKAVQAPAGTFEIPFSCYKGLQTVVNFQMTSPTYKPTSLSPQQFDCGPPIIKLPNIIVSLSVVQVILNGQITDAAGLVKSIPNANIEFVLTPTDPLASNLKTVSDSDGNYQLSIGAVQDQAYTFIIKVTHADFDQFTSKSVSFTASKTQTITENASLARTILQINVSSSFQDSTGKLVSPTQVSVKQLTPRVLGTEKDVIPISLDAKSAFQANIKCYKNIQDTLILTAQFKDFENSDSPKLQFLCDKDVTLPPVKLVLVAKATTTQLTLQGQVTNPLGKGQAGLDLILTTIPVTKILEQKTAADGKWQFIDANLMMKTAYTLQITYKDVQGQSQVLKQQFQTDQAISQATFPEILYTDYIPTTIQGKLTATNSIPVSMLPLTVSCNAQDKTYKNVQQVARTDMSGNFKIQFNVLATLTKNIDCSLVSEVNNPKFISTTLPVTLVPPVFVYTISKQVQITPEFQNQIDKYYSIMNIKGQLISQQTCNGQVTNQPIKDAIAELYQWRGVDYLDLGVSDNSDETGIFVITYPILKTQLQNEMKIEVSKKDFANATYHFNPYAYQSSSSNQININLDIQQMIIIGAQQPCSNKAFIAYTLLSSSNNHKFDQPNNIIQFQGIIQNQKGKRIRNCIINYMRLQIQTDENGEFKLSVPYKSDVQLWIQHERYKAQSILINSPAQVMRLKIVMTKD